MFGRWTRRLMLSGLLGTVFGALFAKRRPAAAAPAAPVVPTINPLLRVYDSVKQAAVATFSCDAGLPGGWDSTAQLRLTSPVPAGPSFRLRRRQPAARQATPALPAQHRTVPLREGPGQAGRSAPFRRDARATKGPRRGTVKRIRGLGVA
jgi:hypothetical protein